MINIDNDTTTVNDDVMAVIDNHDHICVSGIGAAGHHVRMTEDLLYEEDQNRE